MATFCIDISTAPLPNAADFITAGSPPGNYKKPEAIAAWMESDKAERLERASLDPDLCLITGFATKSEDEDGMGWAVTNGSEDEERKILLYIAKLARAGDRFVTYNGRGFDFPVIKRRARYLGVQFPFISTDRYKSPIEDLMVLLSDNEPQRRKSLSFYCKRLGWADLCDKPLEGRDEANVLQTGLWAELEASLKRDADAIYRLGIWAGVI